MNALTPHFPVMLDEVLSALEPHADGLYVDGTFGNGGYSRGLLERADCRVIAIDRDPAARVRGAALEAEFPGRFTLLSGCFGDMEQLLAAEGISRIDGVALDLGVSSMQLDQAERGFSFQKDGPLDMRMGQQGQTAADLVNTLDEDRLADILYHYGEERKSRWVAHAIVERRAETPFSRTADLATVIRGVVRKSRDGIDPATRSFQALRIVVNDELGELERALGASERLLRAGGRLVVVAFHSLEDRIVKAFVRQRCGESEGVSRHLPQASNAGAGNPPPSFQAVSRRAVKPLDAETRVNPRSRSARLRAVERTEFPAWTVSPGGQR
ncbi:16S rRNA (cytosine(1402)-N(4))-methyltransferase RsmH [Rhodospirillum rubrum]|uniref:Ribosomal RNA small subunit methyltransferase H n=1 Tax=Rhodospirillum rubrum (strain ATCC 11170 / ATH 1.1.1 / DSM 467 / LMG 4362 / NCIMB 8255 / S1) TaxID=269796 RepID=RSMH_RHORT|nr:16S rRNA (cytosine(1402)-N(4))-methyltransferase RsmH [Rhodospirillum rubrum]Q2RVT6.1 RecName: Full=Ribosomal RNA small subunit methyltransferase H; AltName: Full=16S rRNA m(4)C1402 methyltransferase; AltName: Full=rRNA (cytosine-N(4)-)-methyltransferase RsmH [Rhodospirillum rubrum ATCC 11170]ABC21759.1 methyltransferase [Rhodospirillum rubrum ATCC 11170]AEO47457.1 16S rRNA m(4)C1402 methyltranserfase [Rhodospirillum rubrum F11]MBK5953316.1 ribosomal RNA small subunit methyltransferase H [Rh